MKNAHVRGFAERDRRDAPTEREHGEDLEVAVHERAAQLAQEHGSQRASFKPMHASFMESPPLRRARRLLISSKSPGSLQDRAHGRSRPHDKQQRGQRCSLAIRCGSRGRFSAACFVVQDDLQTRRHAGSRLRRLVEQHTARREEQEREAEPLTHSARECQRMLACDVAQPAVFNAQARRARSTPRSGRRNSRSARR